MKEETNRPTAEEKIIEKFEESITQTRVYDGSRYVVVPVPAATKNHFDHHLSLGVVARKRHVPCFRSLSSHVSYTIIFQKKIMHSSESEHARENCLYH